METEIYKTLEHARARARTIDAIRVLSVPILRRGDIFRRSMSHMPLLFTVFSSPRRPIAMDNIILILKHPPGPEISFAHAKNTHKYRSTLIPLGEHS